MDNENRASLCVIFEAIGPYSAIGKVAMRDVQIALEAGWQVTVVAKFLDESLRDKVEWLRLYVPPRLFFVQWTTARAFIKSALRGRKFDIVHAHQPQVADLADVFQCHYLTRAAYERRSLTGVKSVQSALARLQEQGVLYAEDYRFRRWNPKTRMLYNSALTRQDFHRIYGAPPNEDTFVCAFPPLDLPTEEERKQARERMIGQQSPGLVLGFLGGENERKGYRQLIDGLKGEDSIFLLMGGAHRADFDVPAMRGRFKAVGQVSDLKTFYHACDVFIVPSHYEPLGLVAFEAAAHGVPVIATEEVGALPHLLDYHLGFTWRQGESLPPLVHRAAAQRNECNRGSQIAERELGIQSYGSRLLQTYRTVLTTKGVFDENAFPI